jgi:hypothetical protein
VRIPKWSMYVKYVFMIYIVVWCRRKVSASNVYDRWISDDTLVCMGHAVAQLVEALHYKREDRGFDSWWCHWNFSLT